MIDEDYQSISASYRSESGDVDLKLIAKSLFSQKETLFTQAIKLNPSEEWIQKRMDILATNAILTGTKLSLEIQRRWMSNYLRSLDNRFASQVKEKVELLKNIVNEIINKLEGAKENERIDLSSEKTQLQSLIQSQKATSENSGICELNYPPLHLFSYTINQA